MIAALALAALLGAAAAAPAPAAGPGRVVLAGEPFELAAVHDRVLENGAVTLGVLRAHVEAWLAEEAR